ncbi:MAG: carboxy-S-adenosyl-L-methionine synthase CmoA [Planctomycetaceae bacterium]
MNEDRIYSVPLQRVGDFQFDDAVADVFPDMIRRSVPGYGSMLSMIAQCTERFAQPESCIYDLGCSLGAATLLIRQHAPPSCQIHAVDNSSAMMERLQKRLNPIPPTAADVILHQADMRDIEIRNASLVVLNLTLQFLPPAERSEFLRKIGEGTVAGGALVLSEKICFDDAAQQELMTTLHHDFKRAHGYSDLEIAQKRTAIENRLIPETMDVHVERLKSAGFRTVCPWLQCFNFASILAVK